MAYCDFCIVKHCPIDKSSIKGIVTFCGHKKSSHKIPALDSSQTKLINLEEGD